MSIDTMIWIGLTGFTGVLCSWVCDFIDKKT